MLDIFVPDGHTETRFVDSVAGLWPDGKYEITFRPPVGYETDIMLNDPKEGPNFLAKKIQKWNVTDKDGAVVEINAKNIEKLHSAFYTRLLAIVGGWANTADGKTINEGRREDQKN